MMNEDTHFLIVGLGLLGGSYAKGLSEKGYFVKAIDINQESLDYALQQGWIQSGSQQVEQEMLSWADVILFGLYPNDLVPWIKAHQTSFKAGTLLSDVTGVKSGIVQNVQSLLRQDCEFIGAHPMAGKEVSGARFSDNTIFEAANFIITPTENNSEKGVQFAHKLAETLNFHHITELSVQEHDKMIAFVSQLTHVIAVTLMNTNDNTHLVEYTGDSFRDLTRIAKINEHLWTELFMMNKENLLQEIDDFSKELAHFREVLDEENIEEMKRLFCQSTLRRKHFDR